jgi:MFS family permease
MRIAPFARPAQEGSPLRNFVQGFRFAMSDVPVRSVLILLSTLSLLGLQYSVFLPVFAKDVLRGGRIAMHFLPVLAKDASHGAVLALGFLMSAAAVGAVLGALHFAARTSYTGLAPWIAATSSTAAVALILFSQSRVFWFSALALLVLGFAATVQMAATNTVVQHRVPDELRGRVMAVYATMFMGVQPLGSLLAGGVAKRIGAPATLSIFGTLCLLAAVAFIFRVLVPIQQRRRTAGQKEESVP